MSHRKLLVSQMSESGDAHSWNHQNRDDHLHLGSVAGNSYIAPMDGITASRVSSMAYSNVASGQSDHSLSIFGSEFSNIRPPSSGILQNPFLEPSLSGSCSQFQSNHVLHAPYHNQLTVGNRSNIVTPVMDTGMATFKRKHPSMPHAFDRDAASGYYSARISSNVCFPSNPSQPSPMLGPQQWPMDLNGTASDHRTDNLLAAREGIQRNTRSRHNHVLPLENGLVGTYSSRNLSHHFHSTVGPIAVGQHSYSPEPMALHRRIFSSDLHCVYNEMNHPPTGISVSNGSMENNRAHNLSLTQSRNMDAMPTLYFGPTRGVGMDHSFYDQRPPPYGPVSSHQTIGFAPVTFEDTGPSRVASSGHSQPLPTVGRRSERNGRGRNFSGRHQIPYEHNAYNRWPPEGIMMFDEVIVYDASSLIDQHRNMRLDIDSMSYEELLALEESIGTVSTGLSEDSISRCLMEITYISADHWEEDEAKCAVCLEGYCDGENLGILRCEHNFHASCITEWLLIKNTCPICKNSALTETKKEKQAMQWLCN